MKFLVLASLKANPPEFGGRREAVAVAEKLIGKWLADGLLDCAYQRIPEGGVVIANRLARELGGVDEVCR